MEQATPAEPAALPSASDVAPEAAEQSAAAPSTTPEKQPDDPEVELAGEKIKLSEYRRLREVEAKRKELDRGAHERFQEAARLRKEAEATKQQAADLVAGLSRDAKASLRAAGIDPVQFAEQVLSDALQESSLTPEQKELREYKAREAKRKEEDEANQKKNATAQEQAAVEHYTNEFSNAFVNALKPMNLPADDLPEAVLRMAQRVEALMESGAPVDLTEIAADVSDRLFAAPEYRLQSLSDEDLLKRYPSVVERVRKALLKQTQTPPKQPAPATLKNVRAPAPKKGLTRAEFEARVAKRIGG